LERAEAMSKNIRKILFTPKMGKNGLKREIHALEGGSDHFWRK